MWGQMKNTMSPQLQLYGLLNSTANDREITCDKSRLNTPHCGSPRCRIAITLSI